MSLGRLLLGRLTSGIVTVLAVTILVFTTLQLVPGGYEEVVLGPFATPELRRQVAERYGLDKPIPVQYFKWLGGVVTGDLGTSLMARQPVATELGRRAPATVELVILALGLSLALGIPLGIMSGLSGSRPLLRESSRFASSFAMSIPDFVLGASLVYLFSVNQWWFKVGGYVPFFDDPVANLRSLALPGITLGMFGVSLVGRTQRDAVRGTLTQPFVTAAVARGERPRTIIGRHVLRNASIPLVTVTAVLVGAFISGSVIAETLFSVPGIGDFFVKSVRNRDYAVVQAAVLVSATVFVVANMLADMLYAVLDPRVGSTAAARRKR